MIIKGEEKYEVERIMNKKWRYSKWKYLVRWKRYTAEEDSWKREANLKNTKEAVDKYKKEYSREERKIEEECRKMPGRFMAKLLYG